MTGRVTVTLRAAAVVLALVAVTPASAATLGELSAPGVPDGRSTTIAADGRVVHVVFFAAWCPPCVEELERLAELDDRWAHDDYRLVIVGVANRQSAERLARFAAGREMPGRLVYDVDGAIGSALGTDWLPAHLVFDGAGREVVRAERLDRSIETALIDLLESGD